jgi:effector-binding domain-containing protein
MSEEKKKMNALVFLPCADPMITVNTIADTNYRLLLFAANTFNSKTHCMEKMATYQVKEIAWPERAYIIKRAVVPFEQLPVFFREQYHLLYSALHRQGIRPPEVASAFYFSIDEAKHETELAAAVQLPDTATEVQGFEKFILPEGKRITTSYYGKYEEMMPAYKELENYLKEKGLTRELYIEEYFSDPEKEKDPAKLRTDIYFAVK